jgi:hypothetical protein
MSIEPVQSGGKCHASLHIVGSKGDNFFVLLCSLTIAFDRIKNIGETYVCVGIIGPDRDRRFKRRDRL